MITDISSFDTDGGNHFTDHTASTNMRVKFHLRKKKPKIMINRANHILLGPLLVKYV